MSTTLDLASARNFGPDDRLDGLEESDFKASRTSIPSVEGRETGPRRNLRKATLDEKFNVIGAAAAAIALTTLLFGWFTPLTGVVGWVIVAFLLFLGLYVVLVALRSDRQEVKDRVMTALLVSAGVVLFSALVFVVAYALVRGREALPHLKAGELHRLHVAMPEGSV